MSKFPKRSTRFGVGKEIGGAVYVHKFYENVLPEAVRKAKSFVAEDFAYTVIKYSIKDETASFIVCDDFDTADEPTVGEACTVKSTGAVTTRKASADPWIYHHKWLFVSDDYTGFDVSKSKARSAQWLVLPNVDFRRIGKKSFWEENVLPQIDGGD
jgi:hypothetical protein